MFVDYPYTPAPCSLLSVTSRASTEAQWVSFYQCKVRDEHSNTGRLMPEINYYVTKWRLFRHWEKEVCFEQC